MIGEKVALVAPEISGGVPGLETEVIDAAGRKVIPGYVDQHVHIIGGGGESVPTAGRRRCSSAPSPPPVSPQ